VSHLKEIEAIEFVVQEGRLWVMQAQQKERRPGGQDRQREEPKPSLRSEEVGPEPVLQLDIHVDDPFQDPGSALGPDDVKSDMEAAQAKPGTGQLGFSPFRLGTQRNVRGVVLQRVPPRSCGSCGSCGLETADATGHMDVHAAPSFGLALPLWQTALAGGLACVSHRAVAASVAELLEAKPRLGGVQHVAKQTGPVLARNLLKFSSGFPFGAACCSLYVNLLHQSAEICQKDSADQLDLFSRFSCASAAVTLASIATYPFGMAFGPKSETCISKGTNMGAVARSVLSHGRRAVASANPVAAVEMCAIDAARNIGSDAGFTTSPGLLFVSGCAAGCFAQSLSHFHGMVRPQPQPSPPRTRRERLQGVCRSMGPAFLKHAPAVGMNALVRVGLVTHFLSQQ